LIDHKEHSGGEVIKRRKIYGKTGQMWGKQSRRGRKPYAPLKE